MVTPDASAGAEALRQTLTAALDRGISIVVTDLAALTTMAADALGAVEAAARMAEEHGQELVLINVSASVATQLAALDLGSTTHVAGPR